MKKLIAFALPLLFLAAAGQDPEKKPVEIFSSTKVINSNTTELVPKGKMDFNVTHNFGDIGGTFGGLSHFFGFDNVVDARIGFTLGVANHLNLSLARAKGAGPQSQLYEINAKFRFMEQRESDPGHPLAIALFANTVIAANPARFPDLENSYADFGDRMSETLQLILARRFGKVSVQVHPTFVTRGHTISYDQKSIFALGGAIRVPVGNRVNLVVDYFHPFRNESSKDSFRLNNNIRFYDPLGIGFEILTPGHVFRLNFTNASEILENRFIPRTITSWGKGQFRWGFTISRRFTLWRPKGV